MTPRPEAEPTVDDLVVWLRERIVARRAAAQAAADEAGDPAWSAGDPLLSESVSTESGSPVAVGPYTGHLSGALREHIAENDPQAVLDLCDAQTAILDEHAPRREHTVDADLVCSTCVYTGWDEDSGGNRHRYREHHDWPCTTVRAVARSYRRDPGYREEWAPPG